MVEIKWMMMSGGFGSQIIYLFEPATFSSLIHIFSRSLILNVCSII